MRHKRISKWLAAMLLISTTASAQVSIPNTFTPNTTAQSALVNANFSQLGQQALNRAGGIITGNISVDPGITIDGIDIGAVLGGSGTPTFANITVTGQGAFTSTGAAAILVSGGITAGSGNVAIIGTDGRIPAISSTTFASLSGINLTSIPETAITDGTLLARVASTETISGLWTFTATTVTLTNASGFSLGLAHSGALTDAKNWFIRTIGGTSNTFAVTTCNEASNSCADPITITRSGAVPQLMTFNTAMAYTGLQNVTLAAGNNNNVSLNGNTVRLRVTTAGGSANIITGLTGGTDGRRLSICQVAGTQPVNTTAEDANSTAANRISTGSANGTSSFILCMRYTYDGTLTRWMID